MNLRILIALAAAAVPVVLANFQAMYAPSTVIPDSPFNITGQFALSDKNGVPIAAWLGIFPFNSTRDPGYVPDRSYGSLGLTLAPFDVTRVYGLPYYFTLEKFIVSKDSLANSQSFYLQWFQIIQYGVLNEVQAESYLMGPIAAGTQVSSTLVPAVLKRFRIEDSVMD